MTNDEPESYRDRIAAARAAQQPRAPRPRRFFSVATVERRGDGYAVLLDGRLARTPARRELSLPTAAAAALLAQEWNRAGDTIDPESMPLTRLANSAIDGVVDQAEAVFDEVMNYVASDLLLYRAGEPDRLVAAQAAAWDPVLELFRTGIGARFLQAQGVMHVAQPQATLSKVRQALAAALGEGAVAPFRLACINVMTALTGSALLALAVALGEITPRQSWEAAHVDERYQESQWGEDAEALARRRSRWLDMEAATALLASLALD